MCAALIVDHWLDFQSYAFSKDRSPAYKLTHYTKERSSLQPKHVTTLVQ